MEFKYLPWGRWKEVAGAPFSQYGRKVGNHYSLEARVAREAIISFAKDVSIYNTALQSEAADI